MTLMDLIFHFSCVGVCTSVYEPLLQNHVEEADFFTWRFFSHSENSFWLTLGVLFTTLECISFLINHRLFLDC